MFSQLSPHHSNFHKDKMNHLTVETSNEYLDTGSDSRFDSPPAFITGMTEKKSSNLPPSLKKLASGFNQTELNTWNSIIESSRHTKHTIRGKAVPKWTPWYSSLVPLPKPDRVYSPGMNSPLLSPLPLIFARSPSPLMMDPEVDSDGEYRRLPRRRANLSISTGPPSPTPKYMNMRHSPIPASDTSNDSSTTHAFTRSQSDGDLFSYVKGFMELKHVLSTAQRAMNEELQRIVTDYLQGADSTMSSGKSLSTFKPPPNVAPFRRQRRHSATPMQTGKSRIT
jgi:hypothetical protein